MNPQLIAALVLSALCFGSGWLVEGWRKDGEIADLEAAYLKRQSADLQQNIDDLAEAARVGRVLVARTAAAENAMTIALQEKNDALKRLTTGRRCLDSAVVRLLNQPPGITPPTVPEAASQPVPADATAATDTDVALWVGYARRAYDTCRGRLAAIADFYAADDSQETEE